LTYLEQLVLRYNIDDVGFVKFTRDDIVRSGITRDFVVAFEEELVRGDPLVTVADIDKQFKKSR
jgi:phosphate starvation-inducible protein PhoH